MAWLTFVAVALGLSLLYFIGSVIYNIYFHPLSKFPGPKLYAATNLPWARQFLAGQLHNDMRRLHEKYGEVVRISPNEISFISPAARRDIYGHANARIFQKDPEAYRTPPEGFDSILTAKDADHSRFRKLLSNAFSDRALKEQEPIIGGHVDLLIQRLRELSGQAVDMVKWYNYTTFDLIGDLAFGEPFGCLTTSSYHPWVALIFESIRAVATLDVLQRFASIEPIVMKLPSEGLKKRKWHLQLVKEKVGQRLASQTTRSDFMKFILRHNDEKGMCMEELEVNASLLILAGSETTATALSGTTYCLLRNPETLAKLVKEIRSQFNSVADMSTEALARCKYLNQVLQEAMRLYTPVPVGLPRRVCQDGAVVAGYPVPKGTVVSVDNFSSFQSTLNFTDPLSFVPERWAETSANGVSGIPTRYQSDRREIVEPFSIGPRNCIGKNLAWIELRLILARVLFEFDLTLVDNGFDPQKQETYLLWQKPALNVKCNLRST